ncbi:MAG TPA: hypothetical protein VLM79_15165 [Kofleriaceae bacterium]|nr:hypothetical protein [Kofleriaceae bacterium]
MSMVAASGKLSVTGYDPDQSTTVAVLSATIETSQEAAFLEAVRVGTAGVQVPNGSGGDTHAIVVSDPGGAGNLWDVPLQSSLTAAGASKARPTGTTR